MEENTQVAENQNVTDYGSQILDRMKSRYPDRNYLSEDGSISPNSLNESIIQALTEDESRMKDYEEKQARYEANTSKLSNLFANSDRAAVFLNVLAETGNPAVAIGKAYGNDAMKAFQDGNAAEMIAKIEQDDAERKSADEEWLSTKESNARASIEELDAWGDEKGLDDEGKAAIFKEAYDLVSDAGEGKYSRRLFDMVYRAKNYDTDIENARREGEVTGRNANIQAQKMKRNMQSGMPPQLSGRGVAASDTPATRKKSFWEE